MAKDFAPTLFTSWGFEKNTQYYQPVAYINTTTNTVFIAYKIALNSMILICRTVVAVKGEENQQKNQKNFIL